MKFKQSRDRDTFSVKTKYQWKAKKNLFNFTVDMATLNSYYVMAIHSKKDIRFNSMWSNITFDNIQDAFNWCELFNHKNFQCLGKDI